MCSHVQMWVCACYSIRVKVGQPQVSVSPGILSDIVLIRWLAVYTKLAGPPAPNESTVFPSHLTVGVLALYTSVRVQLSMGSGNPNLGLVFMCFTH